MSKLPATPSPTTAEPVAKPYQASGGRYPPGTVGGISPEARAALDFASDMRELGDPDCSSPSRRRIIEQAMSRIMGCNT